MIYKTNQQNNKKKKWKNILEIDRLSVSPFETNQYQEKKPYVEKKATPSQRKEFTLFSYSQYYEQEIVKKRIKELVDLIKQEIELIKQSNRALLTEVKDVEQLATNTVSEKPGIYHVRFLEIILSLLKNLRKKVGESKTWLEALITKKKKRGSLFLARSKKMGTSYSLSQELQTARSVQ